MPAALSWALSRTCPAFSRATAPASHQSHGRASVARPISVGLNVELHMGSVNGKVKRIISDKGFGFVAAQDGTEYFFHRSACVGVSFDSLHEGQAVTFDKGQGPKGPRAENISPE
jgi:CspA family cold shock protein